MSFPAYEHYALSESHDLGEIPSHWDAKPLKRIADIDSSGCYGVDEEEGDIGLPVATTAQIDADGRFVVGEMPRRGFTQDEVDRYSCEDGDILVVKSSGSATNIISGKAGLVDEDTPLFIFSNFLMRIRPDRTEALPSFVYAVLRSHLTRQRVEQMCSTTTYPNLQVPEYSSALIPVPPPDEQKAISSFLDVETSKIDGLVSEQRRLIELLKEKRQAVISHAVTKSLNPNAPMKPSGIQWLGDVPQHWEAKPVRYACDIHNTLRTPIDRQTRLDIAGDFPYYGPTGVLSWINKFVVEGEYFLLGEDGDHFLKYRTHSMTVNVEGQFNVNNHAHLIRGKGDCSTKWASLYFEHKDLSPWLIKQGVGRMKLRKEKLQTIPVLVPPPQEQEEILAEICRVKETTKLLIAEAERAIELLQERRTALISAAVTGKIDVREYTLKREASPLNDSERRAADERHQAVSNAR